MANIKFTNFGKAQLLVAPTGTSGLSFTVEAGKGPLYPTPSGSEYFYGIFKDASGNREIVKVENRTGDAFTIESGGRGLDGTVARTWAVGDYFVAGLPAIAIEEVIGNDALNALGQVTPAADKLAYYTGAATAALTDFTAISRTVLANGTAAGMRASMGAVGLTGNDSISGLKTHVGLSPVAFAGSVDDANKTTLNVTEPTGANDLNLPDLSVIRLWNLPAGIGPLPFAGSSIPVGWLECDGSEVSRTVYAALFSAISTTYGIGDGSTTFNLPDMRGRVTIGDGTGVAIDNGGDSEIDVGTNNLTVPSNTDKWITGMAATFNLTSGTVGGLVDDTEYFVIRIDNTNIRLATTRANALVGTAIDITSKSSPVWDITHTFPIRTLGKQGGEDVHSEASDEAGPHTHNVGHNQTMWVGQGSPTGSQAGNDLPTVNPEATGTPVEGSNPANNMQPYLTTKMIISY